MPEQILLSNLAELVFCERLRQTKSELFLHVLDSYTPRDFCAQRYKIIVTSGCRITSKNEILTIDDLISPMQIATTIRKLMFQLKIPPTNTIFKINGALNYEKLNEVVKGI